MPQMHFYVSEATAQDLRRRAAAAGLSVSRYLAQLVQTPTKQGWPDGYFENILGGWKGEPLERPPQGEHEAREPW